MGHNRTMSRRKLLHHPMEEFDKHNVDCKKPHTKANILYGFTYMKFINNNNNNNEQS